MVITDFLRSSRGPGCCGYVAQPMLASNSMPICSQDLEFSQPARTSDPTEKRKHRYYDSRIHSPLTKLDRPTLSQLRFDYLTDVDSRNRFKLRLQVPPW